MDDKETALCLLFQSQFVINTKVDDQLFWSVQSVQQIGTTVTCAHTVPFSDQADYTGQ